MKNPIYTLGHSTRSMDAFKQLLGQFEIQCLADVRSMPGSDHNPQYNQETLKDNLEHGGIDYVHLEGLGGYRNTQLETSPNERANRLHRLNPEGNGVVM